MAFALAYVGALVGSVLLTALGVLLRQALLGPFMLVNY
ncbi:hypothetical protein SAMN05414137_1066 [Streptacidiphilus jiangxiensis]|uniref:Uncharacterized protein n=1 Tax=Streptacidiphilus jiangxiensis TaxID=235985 RepID=A0A1H7MQ42_STRJI|nr:hypothetical protein SAMN05414137_1066 [Streptacidiphilus jiangxiensis]